MRWVLVLLFVAGMATPALACNCQAPVSDSVKNAYLGITLLLGGVPLTALGAVFFWLLRSGSRTPG